MLLLLLLALGRLPHSPAAAALCQALPFFLHIGWRWIPFCSSTQLWRWWCGAWGWQGSGTVQRRQSGSCVSVCLLFCIQAVLVRGLVVRLLLLLLALHQA